jgi:hypothetical protein
MMYHDVGSPGLQDLEVVPKVEFEFGRISRWRRKSVNAGSAFPALTKYMIAERPRTLVLVRRWLEQSFRFDRMGAENGQIPSPFRGL